MNILIKRIRKTADTIDGQLTIDGSLKLCDIAENAITALPAGTYHVSIFKCKQHARKMPVVLIEEQSLTSHPSPLTHGCEHCKKLKYVSNNTSMPRVCPMLKVGNGVYHREDGSIIVGTFIAPGCLKHSKEAFDSVYDRIRKSAERGHEILLEIVEAYPPEKKNLTLYEACQDWLDRVDNAPKFLPCPEPVEGPIKTSIKTEV